MIDFNEMIDNHLKKENRPKGTGRYYPSEIGMCLRKVWYSYKFPMEIKPDLLKIFEVGNIMHDFVVEVLKSEKNPHVQLLKSEFPFRQDIDDFTISGRIDNLLLVKASGKEILVEVKSTTDISFVREAAPHNVVQLQLYMHALGVHNGILLYIDKKNLQSKVFDVPYKKEEAEKIIERFRELHKGIVSDTIPEPEARSSSKTLWMCRYCEYKDKCYTETPASNKWP
ncbi:MAG: PD-(D/E)XK nuclease family protein [Candidatus Aenigmarchaeota archaeon]|nr:PD-(D/E)XK nuclease family protein [Candidatus Aenigmarchaeota archaeon]